MAQGLSNRAFATRLGKSEAAVRKADKAGRIKRYPDGSIDEGTSVGLWYSQGDPARTGARPGAHGAQSAPFEPHPGIVAQAAAEAHLATTRVREILAAEGVVLSPDEALTFNHARTAEKIVQTWERDRAHAEAAGRMIDAAVAERRWADEMVKLRARLLAISGKVAMHLSHLTPHEVQEIDQVVRDTMADAAEDDDDAA